MPHLSGRWVHPCYNGEFLFYPFGASRTITDALAFASDERRNSVFGLTLDLYCDSLDPASSTAPKGDAMFDAAGYFPASSLPAADTEDPVVDVAGGLRWRFSEFVPQDRLSLSRVCAFRAGPGVRVSGDLCYSPPSLHAVSSRWHHSVTMVVASFRAARALRTNPDSCRASSSFEWALSQRFDWTPDQLLKLGFMEPGQWF